MRTILRIQFGSHLYGTETPQSDLDYKSIFVPDARDILLQRAKKTLSTKRPKAEGEKNFAGEIDEEAYSLQNFLRLVSEGQTVALDVLFSPPLSWLEHAYEWSQIVANRKRLLTRKSAAFVGYCRQQANKYGIKGSRVADARYALQMLQNWEEVFGTQIKLGSFDPEIRVICDPGAHPHFALEEVEQASGQKILYWVVCNRKLGYTSTVKAARECVEKIVDEYGHRALQAEQNDGVDWKALSHAVRIGRQAVELLTGHHVAFPRPERDHLRMIKLGAIAYKDVAEEIEKLLEEVEYASAHSTLPEEPDLQWMEDFVVSVYGKEVSNEGGYWR